jgi:hypothetical protein
MSRRPRRNHTPAFKAKVAIAAIKGDRTLVQLAAQLTSIPIRYRPGRINCSKGPPRCLQRAPAPGRRHQRSTSRRCTRRSAN